MKEKELQTYLAGVFSIELNIYTLTRTIDELTKRHNSLARRNKLQVPVRRKPETSLFECVIVAGIASGVVVGLIALIIEWGRAQGFFYYIASVIAALIYAVGGMAVGGVVFGLIAWLIRRRREEARLEEDFQKWVRKYDAEVKKQNERIANEKTKQAVLAREIDALKASLSQSRKALAKAYAYNVLDADYRNIYAVSSFHGYLVKGRTHCLQFNEQTGDQGAYNIYEQERRLDRIITNTEEILVRLDYVMEYQQDLAVGLREASHKIESLCGNVNAQLRKVTGSVANIERCQNVIAYNSERAAKELEFMNWMAIWC